MKLYAERPWRLAGQLLGDLLALAWIAGAWWLADQVHTQVLALQDTGRSLVDAGDRLRGTFADAAHTAGQVPLVGGDLAGALDHGTHAGQVVADAGRAQIETVGYAALVLALAVAILLIVPLLWYWLPRRIRYARAAAEAAALRNTAPDLLALRALTSAPVRRLRRFDTDPAAAWRFGDPEVSRRLAAVQLARLGLRPGP